MVLPPSSLRSYGITLADVHLPQLRHRVHLSGQRVNIEVLISEGIGLQRTRFVQPGCDDRRCELLLEALAKPSTASLHVCTRLQRYHYVVATYYCESRDWRVEIGDWR